LPQGLDRRGFIRSAAATGSCPIRITPPVVDRLTIQLVLDGQHDIFISGAQFPDVGVERARFLVSFHGRTLESQWGLSLHMVSTKGSETQ
jgi:hypothetical protein